MNDKPNYIDLGSADQITPELRILVEKQLSEDLAYYGLETQDFRFDWSESCQEGHQAFCLGGSVESLSGIGVFDEYDYPMASGWMDFVDDPETGFFQTYWEFVTVYALDGSIAAEKKEPGVPAHVWAKLSPELQGLLKDFRIKELPKLP